MLLADLVAVSRRVAATRSRTEKIELLAAALRRLEPDETPIALSYLAGRPTQQRLGAGHVTIYGVTSTPADTPGLELLEVSRVLDDLAAASGPGSKQRKEELLLDLYGRATQDEQDFLRGLMVRNLRQGALEGVMAEAVGSALGVPADRVRRAAMLEGDLVAVSARALAEGAGALGESMLVVFTPVQPMLAATADSAGAAVIELGEAVVEQKLDGLRLQVHRHGDDVKVFTRNLREIGGDVPDVIAAARSLGAESFILDGEGLLLGDGGRPSPFQESMSRPDSNDGWPLSPFFFDILSLDGSDLIDEPLEVRRQALHRLTPPGVRVGSIVTDDPGTAEGFFADSVAAGFEGVVVKDLTQPYEAGRRGSGWLKVKPTHTLDLVILAAEWGSGRRQGWLSNLHLGARDEAGGTVMLGKTFKGLTDEMLRWQTEAFLAIETRRTGHTVYLEPRIVYEVAFDGVQRSTRYPGGVALRFARVKRHRLDKTAEEADTIATVRSFLR
jgi:DNA ligase-1